MSKNIYLASSFWALNREEQENLRAFADRADKSKLDIRAFSLARTSCAAVIGDVTSSLERLKVISPVFSCLNDAQKEDIVGELLLAYYQLSTQYELDRIERLSHKLPETAAKIRLCAQLLNKIRLTLIEPSMSLELMEAIASSEGCTQYLGIKLLVPALLESVDTMASRRQSATDFISFINERRLYWVWAGSTVATLLNIFPDYLVNPSNATATLGWTSLVGGSLSWILYFMRGGFAWCGLIEHVFFPTKEERLLGLTSQERFWIQWEMRKYQILNDTIWGICNCACFFVLVGSGLLGNLGNAFTASLLLMDAVLTVWRMYEEEAQHAERMRHFEKDLGALQAQIAWAQKTGQSTTKYQMAYEETKLRANRAKLDWQYKKASTAMDLLYATCLLAAFTVICLSVLFMPHVALVLAVVGTLMCFSLNLIYNISAMSANVSKAKDIRQQTDDALLKELAEFKELFAQYSAMKTDIERKPMEGQLKMYYLKMRALEAESSYQQKMITHERNHLIVSTIRDILIPPMFIVSLTLLPLGFGVPLLIVSLMLAFGLYWYSQKTMPKKSEPALSFPEASYQKFAAEVATQSPQALKLLLMPEEKPENPGIQPKYVYN